jgi:hypothetical protein
MGANNLGRIHSAAAGFRAALADLSGSDGDQKLAEAMQGLYDLGDKRISIEEAAYLAAMLMAWQDRGSPDVFT